MYLRSSNNSRFLWIYCSDETLRGRINAAVDIAFKKAEGKKKIQTVDSAMLEKGYNDFLAAECGLKRLPRGLMKNAISILETSLKAMPGRISDNDFRRYLDPEQTHAMYREFVQDNSRLFWDCAVSNKVKKDNDSSHGSSHVQGTSPQAPEAASQAQETPQETPSKEEHIRVCDVPLRRILHDFDEYGTRIEEILEDKQAQISDHMDEIQVAILQATTEVFRGLLHDKSSKVDISNILPAEFAIRDQRLRNNPIIEVATLTTRFLGKVVKTGDKDGEVDADLYNMFDQGCLQYLAARLCPSTTSSEPPPKKARLGTSDTTDDSRRYGEHSVWDIVANYIQQTISVTDSAECPRGMSFTRNEMLRTMATNIHNIWSGNIYGDIKRAVVRYLVRLFLRPLSEEWYRKLKKKKAKERKDRIAAKHSKARMRRKRWWQRVSSLVDQLDRVIVACSARWTGAILSLSDPAIESESRRSARVQTLFNLLSRERGESDSLSSEDMEEDDDGDDNFEEVEDENIADEDDEIVEADGIDGFEEALELHSNISPLSEDIAEKGKPNSSIYRSIWKKTIVIKTTWLSL